MKKYTVWWRSEFGKHSGKEVFKAEENCDYDTLAENIVGHKYAVLRLFVLLLCSTKNGRFMCGLIRPFCQRTALQKQPV